MTKRIFDLIVAMLGLLILWPIILAVAVTVRCKLGTPVFFLQKRPGLRGIPFEMVKFRTMQNSFDENGNLLPDSQRVTSLGRFLRSTSLDELPELWNVLKGDMSIVGPRPLLMEYLDYYTEEERIRHNVRPGVTGLAQVRGRNVTTWDERLNLDMEYVRRRTLIMDLQIVIITFIQVFKREGVVAVPSTVYRKLSEEREKLR